jgi:microcin C transport system substrate-binding protein
MSKRCLEITPEESEPLARATWCHASVVGARGSDSAVSCWLALLFTFLTLSTLSAETEDERFPPYDNTAEVNAYYKSKPDFFQFKTIDDLPKDLKWEDGMDLPEFADPKAQKGGTMRYFLQAFPPTLRYVGPGANSSFRGQHFDDIGIYPMRKHPNVQGKYMPGTCLQWSVVNQQTVYVKLDPAAKFSNGELIRTDDYLMMFYVMKSPYIQDPWYNNEYSTKYQSIIKYDDLTFAIVLPSPKPDPLFYLEFIPFCVKFYREFGPDYNQRYNWRAYPTTGAYELDTDTMIKGRKIGMRRVKDWFLRDRKYYRNRFNPDQINYTIIANMDKCFEAFRKGALDFCDFVTPPTYWYDKLAIPEVDNGYIHKSQFYNDFPRPPWGIYLNCAMPGLDDRRVRVGIQHSINVQKVIDIDIRGDYDRLLTTADGYGRFSSPDIKPREFSVEKARAAFASAGYDQIGSDGILKNAKGERLSFELQVRDNPIHRRYGLRFKEEALKAGLELRIQALDNTSAFKRLRDKQHEMCFTAWNSQPPFPQFWEGYHGDNAFEKKDGKWELDVNGRRKAKPNTNNISSTANEALDKIIDQYETAQTSEELESLSHQINHLIYEEADFVPAWAPSFYRTAYWRWIKWPADFNVRISDLAWTNHVLWIDEAEKQATLKAQREGKTFPAVEQIYDQYRAK